MNSEATIEYPKSQYKKFIKDVVTGTLERSDLIEETVNLHLSSDIDLSKIKILKIFKWLKKNNISDQEMLRTFNCGIGFCIIVTKKNVLKIKKTFPRKFQPYEIGFISKNKKKVQIFKNLRW